MSTNAYGGWAGSGVLLVVAVLALLRPDLSGLFDSKGDTRARGTAHVTRVVDGDTIEVRIEGRTEDVRLIGVDTPETVKPGTEVQCFGPRASRFTKGLLEGRRVRLLFGVERRDDYGRLLAYVHLGHRFVNAVLMRRGFARSLTIPPNDRFAPLFRRLELRAARSGRGLWGSCSP
ncbi:MAG: thermonuclease family protein [Solirubrobacterales bacterium]